MVAYTPQFSQTGNRPLHLPLCVLPDRFWSARSLLPLDDANGADGHGWALGRLENQRNCHPNRAAVALEGAARSIARIVVQGLKARLKHGNLLWSNRHCYLLLIEDNKLIGSRYTLCLLALSHITAGFFTQTRKTFPDIAASYALPYLRVYPELVQRGLNC